MGFDATGGKPYKTQQDGPVWYAIVAGVIALSFGVVFLGPKLLGGDSEEGRTIAKLVKGRSVPEAAGLINVYGFSDTPTQTFLARLQTKEPAEHAELLTDMGKSALSGGNRSTLGGMMIRWSQGYAARNTHAIANADPARIDEFLALLQGSLTRLSEMDTGACNLGKLSRISTNPDLFSSYMRYGSGLYESGIQTNVALINLVSSGRKNATTEPVEPDAADLAAVTALVESMRTAPEYASVFSGNILEVDACQTGSSLVQLVASLPPAQKQLFWAALVSGDLLAEKEVVEAPPAG